MKNKKIILFSIIALIAAAVLLIILPPQSEVSVTSKIVNVTEAEVSENEMQYILQLESGEYIRITDKTYVINADGKSFLPESFMDGDTVTVYFDKSLANNKVIDANKVVFEGNK